MIVVGGENKSARHRVNLDIESLRANVNSTDWRYLCIIGQHELDGGGVRPGDIMEMNSHTIKDRTRLNDSSLNEVRTNFECIYFIKIIGETKTSRYIISDNMLKKQYKSHLLTSCYRFQLVES